MMRAIVMAIDNITNEILFVGSLYKNPELFIQYGSYVRSKYDFADEATKFFYDNAEIMYNTHTQTFNKTTISTYFASDIAKLNQYKKFGGYKTISKWIDLAVVEDIEKTFEILKKYSLLREYERQGFNIERIVNNKKFESLKALDVYRMIRNITDHVNTVIMTNQESEILNEDMTTMVNQNLITPDMGIHFPFPIINDTFRGIKLETMMCTGMLSNAGKSRFMFRIIANLALEKKQKVGVLLNEMTTIKMRLCLLLTCINNDEFKRLHGVNITKKEKEVALGIYHDIKGNQIKRKTDEWGEFLESAEEYQRRLCAESPEYNNVIKVAKWIEQETKGLIFAKDVSSCYDDKSLEHEIRKMNLLHGVNYFFYDTLKQDTSAMGDWAALKATTTMLSQLTRELKIFMYASCQLTDDANYIKPHELTSSQIGASKGIKHVLDSLLFFKEINNSEKQKYAYLQNNPDYGEGVPCELRDDRRYYLCVIDKNRDGDKKKIVFEVNLDLNTWNELGELVLKR